MSTESSTQVTQTEVFSYAGGERSTIEREVLSIAVSTGKMFVAGEGKDKVLTDGEAVTFNAAPSVSIYVPDGQFANGSITFADNAVLPNFQNRTAVPVELAGDATVKEPRGDSGGSTGSFESRTVTELAKLAKERGIEVEGTGKNGAKTKADYIKALRA